MSRGQINIFDELIADNFAGGGGASTGIELATGRVVDIAINHDPDAILMHKTNHPYTRHYQTSVWDVDPAEVCGGRPVGLAWFSPDCKHFSKAKGGKPVDKNIRGLAWIVLRWAGTVRPRVIISENVEEFQTWGPVRRGRPVKSKMGQTFQRFVSQLEALGYTAEWRELVAADYGAPTTRKRFFLVARCDGRPIVWPEPTHAPADSPEVKAGRKKPWRSAAEIIDWSLPCPSIFDTREEIKEKYGLTAQRPLRPNTMRRVARGIDKFVMKNPRPYLIVVNHAGEFRGQEVDSPLQTITAKHGYGIASPLMSPWTVTNTTNSTGHAPDEPVDTARTGGGGGQMLMGASLTEYHGTSIGQAMGEPMPTTLSKPHKALQTVHMVKLKGTNLGGQARDPLQTITAGGGHHGIVTTRIVEADPGVDLRNWPKIRELLNTYCGYDLGPEDVILFRIGGASYFMADIGLRMLTPRELYRANGFPDDYIIDRDYTGRAYGKSKQVARCGNAVPPPFATALAPTNPVVTSLYVADNDNVVEMVPQIPGQFGIDGSEQEAPPALKLIKFG